jgi:hypothetical protein
MYISSSPRRRYARGHASRALSGLAGAEAAASGATPVTSYGAQLAQGLMSTVEGMPDAVRTKMLRAALDKIDPRLHAAAEAHAEAEAKAGVPAKVAVQRGIALAASQGLGREIVALGKGRGVAKRSQLGCIPCMALAGTPSFGTMTATTTKYEVRPGWTYVAATTAMPAHWERLRPGQTPQPGLVGTTTTTGAAGGTTVTNTSDGSAAGGKLGKADAAGSIGQNMLAIGPFTVPLSTFGAVSGTKTVGFVSVKFGAGLAGRITYHMPLPSEWQQGIIDVLAKDTGRFTSSMRASGPGTRLGALADFLPGLPAMINQDYIGLQGEKDDAKPLVKFTHPITKEKWGIYFMLGAPDLNKPWGKPDNAPYLTVGFAKINDSLWSHILDVVATVVNFVEDAAKWVGDKTCELVSSSAGKAALLAVGTAAGAYAGDPKAGLQVAAAGTAIASGICEGDQPPPGPPPPAQSSLAIPLLLLGGAGVAVFLLLRK